MKFELRICSNGTYYLYKNNELMIPYVDFDTFNKESAKELIDLLNKVSKENEELKSEIQTQKQIIAKQEMKLAEYNNQK